MSEEPSHLQHMNPEQYRAVTTLKGPLLILAGAGSGKTRVLTRRIAHLLHTGTSAENILAVTFTNKAASEMKERVIELVGEVGEKCWVSTFHSTCCRILRSDIEALGYTRRFAIYDDDDQLRLIKDLLAGLNYDKDRVDARALRGQIDHYKNRMMTVDDVVNTKRDYPNSPLVLLWRDYEEALKAADALDFNDLIGTTVRMFREHPAILAKWRARFHYVMVDEYQDTNRGQYELLALLAGEHRNLAVVGDDDQSIYGFRGADISIILSFEHDNPDATVVRLEQNYRSSSNILNVANNVVSKNEGRLDKKLWTQAPDGPKVQIVVASDPRDEASRVARMIAQLRRQGLKHEDIAVIYRTNAMSRPIEQAFRAARIPHKIVGGRKFYARREVRDVLAYLRVLVNGADDAALLRVVNVPRRGVGAVTLNKLREEAADRGTPLLATARSGTGKTHDGVAGFVALIDELAEVARDNPPDVLVSAVIERSGYRAMLESDRDAKDNLTKDAKGRLDNLAELVKDASSFEAPEGVWTPMDTLTAWLDRIALSADSDDIPEGGQVTMMTVHSSKGLEYPVVFVVQMNEGSFPHKRSEDTGVDEERRLAYVAFTRAMKRLIVCRSRKVREHSGGRGTDREAQASRFLFGLPEESIAGDTPNGDPASDTRHQRKLSAPGVEKLNQFVSWQRQRHQEERSDEELVLVDVESEEELVAGVRLAVPRMGVCELLSRRGTQLYLKTRRGNTRWVNAQGLRLQRVVD